MADITIISNTLYFATYIYGAQSTTSPASGDPLKATYFNCDTSYGEFDSDGNPLPPIGRLYFSFDLVGDLADTYIVAEVLEFSFDMGEDCEDVLGIVVSCSVPSFSFSIQTNGEDDNSSHIHVGVTGLGLVIWSKIGSLDFTIDHSNEAGKGYLKGLGFIYSLCKLGDRIVAYGSEGIGFLKPDQTAWGFTKVSDVGIMCRDAQVGIEGHHWYINTDGDLCEIADSVNRIGYSEFLSTLVNPVMIYDRFNKFIYICDGTSGYVFSCNDYSLGSGGVNISGHGYKGKLELVCSPDYIDIPTMSFTTDILDMYTRKEKTIFNIEISTDSPNLIEAAIDYRLAQDGDFSSTPWVGFTPRGIAYLPCYGIEFKVKLRMATWASFALDQMKINGVIHGFSYLDSLERNY